MFGSGKIAALIEMRDTCWSRRRRRSIRSPPRWRARCRTARRRAPRSRPARRPASTSTSDRCSPATRSTHLHGHLTNTQRRITIVRVDDPSVLPLPATRDAESERQGGRRRLLRRHGVGRSRRSAARSDAPACSSPIRAGTTLRVLDDGAGGKVNVDALSTTTTVTSLTGGSASCRSSSTAGSPIRARSRRSAVRASGFAGRITVNAALLADPSQARGLSDLAADGGRRCDAAELPSRSADQRRSSTLRRRPASAPSRRRSRGSLQSYIRQMISQQGEAAATADSLRQGQEVVVNTLQQRFADSRTSTSTRKWRTCSSCRRPTAPTRACCRRCGTCSTAVAV